MKRIHSFLALGLLASPTVHAQLFLEAHGSFLMPVGGLSTYEYTGSADVGTYSTAIYNAGRGVGGGLVVGAALGPNVSIEGRFTYVSGKEQSFSDQEVGDSYTETLKSKYIRFDPAVRIHTKGDFQGYVAVGPSLALAPRITYTDNSSESGFDPDLGMGYSYSSTYEEEMRGGIGFGGFGAVGFVAGNRRKAISYFAELQFTALSWAPREGDWKETWSVSTPFGGESGSDSGTISYENEVGSEAEDEDLRMHFPMSTWGLRAGVRYSFGR